MALSLSGTSPDAADGRVVCIRATAKGARILRDARRRRVAALSRDVACLGEAEVRLLARATEIVERLARRPD